MNAFINKFNPNKSLIIDNKGLSWKEFLKINPVELFQFFQFLDFTPKASIKQDFCFQGFREYIKKTEKKVVFHKI